MSSSRFAAVHIVPLLGRILLFGAFVLAGYGKVFTFKELTPAQAARLDAIGWSWTPPPDAAAADAPPSSATTPSAPAKPASATTPPSAPAKPAASPTTPSAPAKPPAAAPSAALLEMSPPILGAAPPSVTPAPPPAPAGAVATTSEGRSVRGVYEIALFLDANGIPAPRATAWLVAIIELVGGALILPGIFTRLWALGMVGVMVGAIGTTSLGALKAHPYLIGMSQMESATFIIQASLLIVSFGILLTGPGAASIDHAIFGRSNASGSAARPARTGASSAGGGTS